MSDSTERYVWKGQDFASWASNFKAFMAVKECSGPIMAARPVGNAAGVAQLQLEWDRANGKLYGHVIICVGDKNRALVEEWATRTNHIGNGRECWQYVETYFAPKSPILLGSLQEKFNQLRLSEGG